MSERNIVVLNQSGMSYKLRAGADGKPRLLEPGKSIETLDAKEAELLLDYKGIVDAEKVIPGNDRRIAELTETIKRLTAENEELRKKTSKAAPVSEPEPVGATADAKKKGSSKKG